MIRVLLADDQEPARVGLTQLLTAAAGIRGARDQVHRYLDTGQGPGRQLTCPADPVSGSNRGR